MAFLLNINPLQNSKNDRVTFPDILLTGDFLVRCRCELYNHLITPAGMLFGGGNSGGGVEVYRNGSLGVQLFINGTSVGTAGNVWPYWNEVDDNPRYVDLRRVGSTLTVEIGGSPVITVSNSAVLKINTLGSRGTAFYLGFRFYDLEITNGAFYRKYDASLYDGVNFNVLRTNDGVNNGTLIGFPNDGSEWISYSAGPVAYSITAETVSDNHVANDVSLTYAPAATAYSIVCEAVSDSHVAGEIGLYRGYSLACDSATDSHVANDVTLIYSAGATNYSITCETVSDTHSAGDIALNRGYTLTASTVTDAHQVGAVTLTYTGATGTQYILTCETVTDAHSVGDIVFNRGYVLQVSTVTDSHIALPVILRYSGEEIALIGSYSVNYRQSDVAISYNQSFYEVRYGDG